MFWRSRKSEEATAAEKEKIEEVTRKTRSAWFGRVTSLFGRRSLDESVWEELEEILVGADVGINLAEEIIGNLRTRASREGIREAEGVRQALHEELVGLLEAVPAPILAEDGARPRVYLMVGANGVGKTTSIAKLGSYLQQQGQRVLFAAGDTFRAGAIEQINIWGERLGVDVVAHQPGADPGAVVFDAIQAATSRGVDALIVDTAGRLHTKFNLMEEMKKIKRVVDRFQPPLPQEVLLVLDGTTGQNAISQARSFTKTVTVTGLVLTKLDGTAKGGAVFPIVKELNIPIRFLGAGEKVGDFVEFDAQAFVGALLGHM
ncbi:MAG: signal recognition particle-docking protein FtsY [Dehalococcoidia bacterium]|nr:signal recognition particle-docking protein FtsY [Dehalococcoidia bacterium]